MSNFVDLIALQKEWAHLLLGDETLNRINVVTRDFIIANESRLPDETLMAEVLAYITPRNGREGCGVIVERPAIRVPQAVSPGPQKIVVMQFLILEDRLTNEGPITGTRVPADWVAQRIIELGHHQYIEGVGDFYADNNVMTEARDFAPLNAWRVTLLANLETQTANRLALPTLSSNDDDEVVLTNAAATPDAEIFYTTDESFPARDGAGNPASLRHTAPMALESGTILRWAAYQNNYLPSQIGKTTVTLS